MRQKKPLEQGKFCPYSKIVENFLGWESDCLLQEYSCISLMRNVKNLHFHNAHCVRLDLWLNVKVENIFSFNVIFSMHENEISNSVEVFSAF